MAFKVALAVCVMVAVVAAVPGAAPGGGWGGWGGLGGGWGGPPGGGWGALAAGGLGGAGGAGGAGAGAVNPWIPPWISQAPWYPQWGPCTMIGTTCLDCNTKLVCTKVGGLQRACTDPTLPHCNLGECSATPTDECAAVAAPVEVEA